VSINAWFSVNVGVGSANRTAWSLALLHVRECDSAMILPRSLFLRQSHRHKLRKLGPFQAQSRARRVRHNAKPGTSTDPQTASPRTATEAVENGDLEFGNKDYAKALLLYQQAMQMGPNADEARAARYNAACAHVKLQQWEDAIACLESAVNEYNLKVMVIYKVRSAIRGVGWGSLKYPGRQGALCCCSTTELPKHPSFRASDSTCL
jgi:tetratricopeptide (TPR) repeat protein